MKLSRVIFVLFFVFAMCIEASPSTEGQDKTEDPVEITGRDGKFTVIDTEGEIVDCSEFPEFCSDNGDSGIEGEEEEEEE